MRKKFSTLLALLLVLALLAACGSGAASTASDGDAAQSDAETSDAASEESEEPEAEESTAEAAEETAEAETEEAVSESPAQETESASEDGEGAQESAEASEAEEETASEGIQAKPDGAEAYPLADGDVTLTYFNMFISMSPSLYDEAMDVYCYQQAEERTGIKIEYSNCNMWNYSEQFTLMIAGGDYTDLVSGVHNDYPGSVDQAIDDAFIIDLNEYKEYAPNYYYIIDNNETVAKDTSTDTGKRGIFYQITNGRETSYEGLYVNTNWLEELGLDMPKTVADYTEVLGAFKTAYDLDYSFWLEDDATSVMAYAYDIIGGDGSTVDLFYQIDGTVHYSVLEEGYKEYIQLLADWYQAGYIATDYATLETGTTDSDYFQAIAKGNVGVFTGDASVLVNADTVAFEEFTPSEEFYPVANAVTEEGNITRLGRLVDIVGTSGISITTDCENIEMAMGWVDYWYTDEGGMLMTYGEEGLTYEYDEEGRVVFTDLIANNPDYGASSMLAAYCSIVAGLQPGYTEGGLYGYDSVVATAGTIWAGDHYDPSYVLSSKIMLTTEESEEYSLIAADALTTLAETIPQFIMGVRDMSEWDSFIEQFTIDFDVDRMIEIKQAAYDRYLNR